MIKRIIASFCIIISLCIGCKEEETTSNTLFKKLSPDFSGVEFTNSLEFDSAFNIYTYRNFYNGGGVAIGDINSDSLPDIYFTANQKPNRLFINKGNMQFEDVSESSGTMGQGAWSTGVAMADVNGDGLLDIYVCNSGDVSGDNKQNELFINNGDLTFTERAEEYGLADKGLSTHIAFFDYDKDGDLDAYLLNNSFKAIGTFNQMNNVRDQRDSVGGDKLYRNDNGFFNDVSEEAGIYGSIIGFGLGVTVGDVNRDGWQDIFVSNDFFERDYLYVNNQDGSFNEVLESSMNSISAASMGADMADINNDGYPEIFVTDMLPEPLDRLKQVTTFENWDKITYNVKNGYHYQYNRNMLHLNNADGTFSEVARLAGVEATDWSWGALFFDADNDGLKDIFVANGIYQDITDLDYLNFIADDETKAKIISENGVDYNALIDPIPINPISNYFFKNAGNLKFEDVAEAWGIGEPISSNGAAYGDLDNDGDYDLVVNNLNASSTIYRNDLEAKNAKYLKIALAGKGKNTHALGAQITVYADEKKFYVEQMPIRGFQSSIDPVITLGLGDVSKVDSLKVVWPSGVQSYRYDILPNQVLNLTESGEIGNQNRNEKGATFSKVSLIEFTHDENTFVDFDRDRLTYHMLSTQGPRLAVGDVNGDGNDDIYIGGAKGQPGKLFIMNSDGDPIEQSQPFEASAKSEDTDAIFFDTDGDADLDLFVTSGGNEFTRGTPELRDRLYINDGTGNFSQADVAFLKNNYHNSSSVAVADIDGDNDLDLFIGTRTQVFEYGIRPDSYLLLNDGEGNFQNVSGQLAEQFKELGLVTDVNFSDIDNDSDPDLIVVGEWMSPTIFKNEEGELIKSSTSGLDSLNGWWNRVENGDLNNDGYEDLILLNHGFNSRFDASSEEPLRLYVNDFDGNGAIERIYCKKGANGYYPLTLKHELVAQLPQLKKYYLKYTDYNNKRVDEIFDQKVLESSTIHELNFMPSVVALNDGTGNYSLVELPVEAQFSPMFGVGIDDVNEDGKADLLLGGNFFEAKPEAGRYDASYGVYLIGNGDGTFKTASNSGFNFKGQARDIALFRHKGKRTVVVGRNNDSVVSFNY